MDAICDNGQDKYVDDTRHQSERAHEDKVTRRQLQELRYNMQQAGEGREVDGESNGERDSNNDSDDDGERLVEDERESKDESADADISAGADEDAGTDGVEGEHKATDKRISGGTQDDQGNGKGKGNYERKREDERMDTELEGGHSEGEHEDNEDHLIASAVVIQRKHQVDLFRDRADQAATLTSGWDFFVHSQLLHMTIGAISNCVITQASKLVQRYNTVFHATRSMLACVQSSRKKHPLLHLNSCKGEHSHVFLQVLMFVPCYLYTDFLFRRSWSHYHDACTERGLLRPVRGPCSSMHKLGAILHPWPAHNIMIILIIFLYTARVRAEYSSRCVSSGRWSLPPRTWLARPNTCAEDKVLWAASQKSRCLISRSLDYLLL